MSQYIADQSWPAEAQRLHHLERALDEHTRRHLLGLGLRSGMCCLEIGAGSGSIARFMAAQVGAAGQVTATDLDISLLAHLPAELPQLRVLREDISESIPRSGRVEAGGSAREQNDDERFDLVHARLVLGHVAQPERALANIVQALKPGGVALLEDADFLWTELGEQPLFPASAAKLYFPVWRAAVAYMQKRGYAVHWGRQLAAAMRGAGLENVAGEAVIPVGSRALQASMELTLARFAPALVEEGWVAPAELEACLEILRDPQITFTGSPTFSVWGSRPR